MRSSMLVKKNEFQTETVDLSQIPEFAMDKDTVYEWAGWLETWIGPIVFAFMFVVFYVLRIIQIVIYGVVGLVFAAMTSSKIPYGTLMRLSAVALTPVIVLDTVFDVAGIFVPYWTWIGIGVGLVYLFIAIKSTGDIQSEAGAAPPLPPDDPMHRPI
jgi:hypothetical protein